MIPQPRANAGPAMAYIAGVFLAYALATGCSHGVQDSRSDDAVLRMKNQCKEAGEKAEAEWVARYTRETFSDSPEYAYSPKLNTCLYADEYTDVNTGRSIELGLLGAKSRRDRFVLDVYTNKVLLEYTEHNGQSITNDSDAVNCRSEAEFVARKAELFDRARR